jgi:hypothetical protein
MNTFLERARRAARKPPREVASRLMEIGWTHLQRPWSSVYPRVLTHKALVRSAGSASIDALWQAQQAAPFFVSPERRPEWTRTFRARYPDAPASIVSAAERVVRHEFDLLGSGPVALGAALPWHSDFKSGRDWPVHYSPDIEFIEIDKSSDVKVPWELSRCQHFTALGQAYWLTGDERYAQEFVDEVTDWIARNPWGYGVNWACAMDVALRAVSWMWGFYFFADALACRPRAFRAAFLRALYLHGEYIASHLERADVNGNHYLCDGVGLVFLGAFFRSTRKGQRWLSIGREIVQGEMFNQTTKDGVDFEKSTAYHRLVLEAFLTCGLLLELHGERPSFEWLARLDRMLEFVDAYVKPDGLVPLIGDADDGRVQKLGPQPLTDHRYLLSTGAVVFGRADFKRSACRFWEESFWLLGPDAAEQFDRLRPPSSPLESKAFPEGGFYVLRTDRAHVIVDCGEVGMRGRGGHGHSDITSIEVWLDGVNLVSDCGAYLYTASREWRNRFRGTAFHNVVQIDDEELNRLVSPDQLWQLCDDARPRDVTWRFEEHADYFRGGHDGYARLTPPALVTREVLLMKDSGDVLIRDTVALERDGVVVEREGLSRARRMTSRFHLDPAVTPRVCGSDVCLSASGREMWLQVVDPIGPIAIDEGWVSPSYGVRTPTSTIVLQQDVRLPVTITCRFGVRRLDRAQLVDVASGLNQCVNC